MLLFENVLYVSGKVKQNKNVEVSHYELKYQNKNIKIGLIKNILLTLIIEIA